MVKHLTKNVIFHMYIFIFTTDFLSVIEKAAPLQSILL